MSNTLQTHSPERIDQSTVDVALSNAIEAVANIETDLDFQAYLSDTNQKLDYTDAREYWGTMAGFTETYLDRHDDLTSLEKASFTLIANLPATLTASYSLKQNEQRYYPEKKDDREAACTYNSLLKHFVMTYPLESESLSRHLLDATLETIGAESKDFLTHAETAINVTLKGIKHEIGFMRLLDAAHIPYREATVDEDLKGRDVVILHPLKEIGVDVKASLSEVEAHSHDGKPTAYVVKQNGDIIMYSMMKESAFHGGFEPSQHYLSEFSEGAGNKIVEALAQSIAK